MSVVTSTRVDELAPLVRGNLDSRDGLRHVATKVLDAGLQSLCERWAQERKSLADELLTIVPAHELKVHDEGPGAKAIRNAWTSVRDTPSPADALAVLADIERAEAVLESAYNAVLRSGRSGADTVLQRHRAAIRTTIDQARGLRIALESQRQRKPFQP